MEKKKSYKEFKIEENQNKINFEDIFKNSINFQILILLFIYSELNIPNIAKILGISKSTAIRHLTEMENYKLIELSKEQKVRSDLKTRFYKLSPSGIKNLPSYTPEQIKGFNESQRSAFFKMIIESLKYTANFVDLTINLFMDYLDKKDISAGDELQKMMEDQSISFNLQFYTENQFKKFLQIYTQFIINLRNMFMEEYKDIQEHPEKLLDSKPYCWLNVLLPIQQILESKKKDEKEEHKKDE